MRFAYVFVLPILLAGCAHPIDPSSVNSVNIYTTRDAKIPGKYNLVIDDNIKGLVREVKMVSHACSAYTYPMSVGDPLAQSIRNATRSAFESAMESRSDGQPGSEISGTIIYRLEDFNSKLSCIPGFWTVNCTSTTEIGMNVMVRDGTGKVVVNTAANATRNADGEAGSACTKAGDLAAESFTKATKEVLERLLERVSNAKL